MADNSTDAWLAALDRAAQTRIPFKATWSYDMAPSVLPAKDVERTNREEGEWLEWHTVAPSLYRVVPVCALWRLVLWELPEKEANPATRRDVRQALLNLLKRSDTKDEQRLNRRVRWVELLIILVIRKMARHARKAILRAFTSKKWWLPHGVDEEGFFDPNYSANDPEDDAEIDEDQEAEAKLMREDATLGVEGIGPAAEPKKAAPKKAAPKKAAKKAAPKKAAPKKAAPKKAAKKAKPKKAAPKKAKPANAKVAPKKTKAKAAIDAARELALKKATAAINAAAKQALKDAAARIKAAAAKIKGAL